MVTSGASAHKLSTRTIYLPSMLNDDVYTTLQRSFQESRGADLVVDATYLDALDSRLAAFLRSAMAAWSSDHHSLTVVRGSGAGALIASPDLV
jgi:hypothetical protein